MRHCGVTFMPPMCSHKLSKILYKDMKDVHNGSLDQCTKHVWRKFMIFKVIMRMILFDIIIIFECMFMCKSLSYEAILFNYNSV